MCVHCNTVAPPWPRCAPDNGNNEVKIKNKKKYVCKINENNGGYGGVKNSGENKASPLQRCLNITTFLLLWQVRMTGFDVRLW
jgi:hypothetical protein